jgi:hypothetical protein
MFIFPQWSMYSDNNIWQLFPYDVPMLEIHPTSMLYRRWNHPAPCVAARRGLSAPCPLHGQPRGLMGCWRVVENAQWWLVVLNFVGSNIFKFSISYALRPPVFVCNMVPDAGMTCDVTTISMKVIFSGQKSTAPKTAVLFPSKWPNWIGQTLAAAQGRRWAHPEAGKKDLGCSPLSGDGAGSLTNYWGCGS